MEKEDKLRAIGALGGIVIVFLSILLTPPLEIPAGVYMRMLYMGVIWFFFMFGIAPKLVKDREPPNYRYSGEGISREKLMTVVELFKELGLAHRSTKDPVVLALIKKTERKCSQITEMVRKGEITVQQCLDDWLGTLREGHALMGMLEEAE